MIRGPNHSIAETHYGTSGIDLATKSRSSGEYVDAGIVGAT